MSNLIVHVCLFFPNIIIYSYILYIVTFSHHHKEIINVRLNIDIKNWTPAEYLHGVFPR